MLRLGRRDAGVQVVNIRIPANMVDGTEPAYVISCTEVAGSVVQVWSRGRFVGTLTMFSPEDARNVARWLLSDAKEELT